MLRPRSDPASYLGRPALALLVTTIAGVVLSSVNVAPTVAFVIEGFVLLTWTSVLFESRRLEQLAEGRNSESICAFARSFDCRAIDTWILRAVYETLQEFLAAPHFPLRASDRLSDDLAFDADDLDELADEIAERSGRTLENAEYNPLYSKVESVRDLVLFFTFQPASDVPAA